MLVLGHILSTTNYYTVVPQSSVKVFQYWQSNEYICHNWFYQKLHKRAFLKIFLVCCETTKIRTYIFIQWSTKLLKYGSDWHQSVRSPIADIFLLKNNYKVCFDFFYLGTKWVTKRLKCYLTFFTNSHM